MKYSFLLLALAVGVMGCSKEKAFDLSRAVQAEDAKTPFILIQSLPGPQTGDSDEDDLITHPLPPTIIENGFRNTYYYLILESDYVANADPNEEKVAILDMNGKTLAVVSPRFRKDLLMEGSGKLLDGRVLNYAGRVNGEARFHVTRHSWGRGAGNCPLTPFKTIAVDSTQIPLGSVVYIDETRGMRLPDGTVHNGVWYAQDTGGAILHDRIDIFIGHKKQAGTLTRGGITHMRPLTIRILRQPDAESCAHQPPR